MFGIENMNFPIILKAFHLRSILGS